MDEPTKKDAKLPMPSCRLCGVRAVDAAGGRMDAESGCCLVCAVRRDGFATSLVQGCSAPEEGDSDETELAWARDVYRRADALVIGRAHADLPKEPNSEAS